MIKNDKALREYIRKQIMDFLKEDKTETNSGMTKAKDTKVHTDSKKEVKPKSTKVTDDTKPASVTATVEVEADDNEVEVKTMKDKDEPKDEVNSFECEELGVKLKVKGKSMVSVNALYFIGQARKALEGAGEYIESIDVKMGKKKDD